MSVQDVNRSGHVCLPHNPAFAVKPVPATYTKGAVVARIGL